MGILLILILLTGLEMIRELNTFRITDYEISSGKLRNLSEEKRIVLLSDLHNHVYGKDNSGLLDAVKNAKPDLILISGDMLVGKRNTSWQAAYDFVSRLPEICPVYYGNGNHEQRMKEEPEKYGREYFAYRDKLISCGVHFLENESEEFRMDGCQMRISGLELPAQYYRKFRKHCVGKNEVERCLGSAGGDAYEILIAHNPVFYEAYRTWGADLVVSGHLHGGIVRIPGIGGMISPQAVLLPRYSGELTREGESCIVVSKGLGSHTVNIRLFNPAEVVVLHLRGE